MQWLLSVDISIYAYTTEFSLAVNSQYMNIFDMLRKYACDILPLKFKKGKISFQLGWEKCISDYLVYCVYVCKLKDALRSGLKKKKKSGTWASAPASPKLFEFWHELLIILFTLSFVWMMYYAHYC